VVEVRYSLVVLVSNTTVVEVTYVLVVLVVYTTVVEVLYSLVVLVSKEIVVDVKNELVEDPVIVVIETISVMIGKKSISNGQWHDLSTVKAFAQLPFVLVS